MKLYFVFGLLLSVILSTACSDGSNGSTPMFQDAPPPILTILVTNDDGIGAPGIDTLVSTLIEMDNVNVELVAPAVNQSGAFDLTTEGGVVWEDSATTSGYMGVAVDGYPADSVNVALQDLGINPHLVVSGINSGPNVGPLIRFSGTVGAARVAARAGHPAVAISAGGDEAFVEYDTSAALLVDWIEMNRSALLDGSASSAMVVNFNIPTCSAGEVRELLEVPRGESVPAEVGSRVRSTDCTVEPESAPTNDVEALVNGHPSLTLLALEE